MVPKLFENAEWQFAAIMAHLTLMLTHFDALAHHLALFVPQFEAKCIL